MKLKHGQDPITKEHILIIPNQFTLAFSETFDKLRVLTATGSDDYDIDIKHTKVNYADYALDLNNGIRFYSGNPRHGNKTRIATNYRNVMSIMDYLMEFVPFDSSICPELDNAYNVSNLIDVKIFPHKILLIYNNDGFAVNLRIDRLPVLQYFFKLRDIVSNLKTLKDEASI